MVSVSQDPPARKCWKWDLNAGSVTMKPVFSAIHYLARTSPACYIPGQGLAHCHAHTVLVRVRARPSPVFPGDLAIVRRSFHHVKGFFIVTSKAGTYYLSSGGHSVSVDQLLSPPTLLGEADLAFCVNLCICLMWLKSPRSLEANQWSRSRDAGTVAHPACLPATGQEDPPYSWG